MKAGFKRVDITPAIGISMGSNFRDQTASRGAHDSLNADIMYFEEGREKIALIDVDWCEAPFWIMQPVKAEIAAKSGIDYSRICLTMTHTHSGPDTYGYFCKDGILESTKAYMMQSAATIAEGLRTAVATAQDVLMGVGKGYEDEISFNRRVFAKNGVLYNNWEIHSNPLLKVEDLDRPEGPIDPDVYVVKFATLAGETKAIMVNFALHPVTLEMLDWLFSKDFIWKLEEDLRKEYGEDVLIYFANGAEGNINHIDMWNKGQNVRAWSEAERIGLKLAHDVKAVMQGIEVKAPKSLKALFKTIPLPVRAITREEIENAKRICAASGNNIPEWVDGVPPEWSAQSLLKVVARGRRTEDAELFVIRLGDIVIATIPGEIFVEYGLDLKRRSPCRNTIVVAVANHCLGYIPTAAALKNGGMETQTHEFSLLAPEAGDMIVAELLAMIGQTA